MRHKTVILVLILLIACGLADAANPFRRRRAKGGMFPDNGDIPDLTRTGKVLTYEDKKFTEFYGEKGNLYLQYGMLHIMVGDYRYGGDGRRLTIELATMENPTAATGLYHHHRGNIVIGKGEPVKVGAEGVLDTERDGRTLYFYRSNIFAKIIYSGKDPVPNLLPIAKYIDERIPGGRDDKPDGFAYIEVEGVNKDTVALTPGYTFNISFLPPSVWASAPGGGSVASDLFIITRNLDRDAAQLYSDYNSYLKLYAEYVEEYRRGKQRFTKAVDPNQGRIVFTSYKNALILAVRPDGYDKGEVLIDRVIEKIDEVLPARRGGKRKKGKAAEDE